MSRGKTIPRHRKVPDARRDRGTASFRRVRGHGTVEPAIPLFSV